MRSFRTLALLALGLASGSPQVTESVGSAPVLPGQEALLYSIEWRLITAGQARLSWTAGRPGWATRLDVFSTGLVSKLFKVENAYLANFDERLCAQSSLLTAHEGTRHRETRVTYNAEAGQATYLERDLTKGHVVSASETEIPACVHDVVGALYRMRTLRLEPGQHAELPLSDGKRSVDARVEALDRETIETPSGQYRTVRHEAFLFNDVLFRRPGRLFIWLTDDERRLPVQIQVRLQLHVGTVTVQLEKIET
ncbi:MAG: DUF3108 domain-containing protein [Bryobacterales bacterium]|jgi:hypothetical protein|nr:DUF3108 domain-containing protein [Bryobacterales bacterium]